MGTSMSAKRANSLSRRNVLAASAATAIAGFPHISNAQAKQPIKIGMPTVLSGPFTVVGETCRAAAQLVLEGFNAAGGLNGRMVELLVRDDKAKPDEAARVIREFINNDKVDLFISGSTTAGAFAIQEVVRETGHLCINTVSETTVLTADPKIRAPNSFRVARQGVQDSVAAAQAAANLIRTKNLKRWMTVCQDFAYGRSIQAQFVGLLKQMEPTVEIVATAWPKFMAPDYTDVVTQILSAKPDVIYCTLASGEMTSFIDQANLYAMFERTIMFSPNIADISTLRQIKTLPKNVITGSRYVPTYPNVPGNLAWATAMQGKGVLGSNWGWQTSAAAEFLLTAMRKTNSIDSKLLAEALRGMTIDSPFGAKGKMTIRAEDQTLIDYAIGWGFALPAAPYMKDVQDADWAVIAKYELEWKKSQGFV